MSAPTIDQDTAAIGVNELRRLVCATASRFDPSSITGEAAIRALQEWSTIVNAAQTAVALAAARIAECGPPAAAGARDASDFVAKATGTTSGRAKDTITHGRRISAAPKTLTAAARGQLSPEQATAIADAVAVNPDAEDELLDDAVTSPVGELRRRCADKKAERQDLAAVEAQIHARRCLRRYRDADGAEHLHAIGTRRDLAAIDAALKPLIEARFIAARRAGEREAREAYAFDALLALAGHADSSQPGAGRPKRRRDPIRHRTILRIDLTALVRGTVAHGETCEIAGLGPISITTPERSSVSRSSISC